MSDREDFIATLQACYFGDRNAFNKIVSVYDDLQQENQQLKENLKATKEVAEEHLKKEIQLKEVIDEVRELRNQFIEENELFCFENNCLINLMNKLLQILDKVKEN